MVPMYSKAVALNLAGGVARLLDKVQELGGEPWEEYTTEHSAEDCLAHAQQQAARPAPASDFPKTVTEAVAHSPWLRPAPADTVSLDPKRLRTWVRKMRDGIPLVYEGDADLCDLLELLAGADLLEYDEPGFLFMRKGKYLQLELPDDDPATAGRGEIQT